MIKPAFVVLCMLFTKDAQEKMLKERWAWDWRMRNDVRINEVQHTYFNETFKNEMLNVGVFPKQERKTIDFVLSVDDTHALAM